MNSWHTPSLRLRRITVEGDHLTPVLAPVTSKQVSVGNAGSDDLLVYSLDCDDLTDGDDDKYLIVPAGYERMFKSVEPWRKDSLIFYLKRTNNGDVVIVWS